MVDEPRKTILGICLDENIVRLAEVEKILERYKATHLSEISLQTPFSLKTLQEPELLERLSNFLQSIIIEEGYDADEVNVAVSPQYAIVKRIPYETSLSSKELKNHILWELQQYIISSIENYTFDAQTFTPSPSGDQHNLLFVGVRNIITEALESIFENIDISLRAVTVDFMAMMNAIEYNYDFNPDDTIALIEIESSGIIITLIENSEYIGYRAISYDELGGLKNIGEDNLENLVSQVSKQLRFLFADYWSESDKSAFDHVLLTRNSSHLPIEPLARAGRHIPLQIIQPFRKITLSDDLQQSLDKGVIFAEYMGAIGVTIAE